MTSALLTCQFCDSAELTCLRAPFFLEPHTFHVPPGTRVHTDQVAKSNEQRYLGVRPLSSSACFHALSCPA
jgi:hypothetical protein